jgi:lipopolysaccharide/colanic/teichoic acid biosynthesis glycosyltransferase
VSRAARPLLYGGVLAIVFGLARAHAAFIGHYDVTGTSRFTWTIVYAALLCTTAYAFGLPDLPRTRRTVLSASVAAAWLGAGGMSLLQLFVGDALLPRFVVFGSALLLPDWFRICIRLSAGGRTRAEARDRVAIIADPVEVAELEEELRGAPERPASIVARLTIAEAADGEPLLRGDPPTVVVLDRAALGDPSIVHQVAVLHEQGVRVRTLTAFYEEWLGKVPLGELERAALMFDIKEVHGGRYVRTKRLVDLGVAAIGAVPFVLLLPVFVVGNLLGNRGPLFYRQERVGRRGKEFTIVKLRTMRPAEPGADATWTAADDDRVTRFGRVLRRTHLDELPQLLNIVRGDLSVVGPRPEQPKYVAELRQLLPFYDLRHVVQPGLTGWAQVNYGYAGDQRDALQKLQYDFWYLRNQGLGLDLRIIGRTIRSVTGSRGGGR